MIDNYRKFKNPCLRVFFLTTLLLLISPSIYSQCDGWENVSMIPDPSGSTPAPYDMTLTCLEIINPECFGDEAIVSFEWEISSGTTMGIFSLINTTTGEELNGDLNNFRTMDLAILI